MGLRGRSAVTSRGVALVSHLKAQKTRIASSSFLIINGWNGSCVFSQVPKTHLWKSCDVILPQKFKIQKHSIFSSLLLTKMKLRAKLYLFWALSDSPAESCAKLWPKCRPLIRIIKKHYLFHFGHNSASDCARPAMSNPRFSGRMRPVKGFARPCLGFRCSKSILHTDNLSLFW